MGFRFNPWVPFELEGTSGPVTNLTVINGGVRQMGLPCIVSGA